MPDMLFLLRRLAGTLDRIEGDLDPVKLEPVPVRARRPDPKARAEAVFGKPAPRRDASREIPVAIGRRVRVLEHGVSKQVELGF